MGASDFARRLVRLDVLLAETAWLWRPQPFKCARPDWYERLPTLSAELLALDDVEVTRFGADHDALSGLLARHVPELAELGEISRLDDIAADLGPTPPHLDWAIPGRKWAQARAFAGALGPPQAPVLEWCGGKGHLGRLLTTRWSQPVHTLERDMALCAEGERLATRAKVTQRFHCLDALGPAAAGQLPGRHAVALHACGELHRTLVREAVAARTPALDIAPCCYHLGAGEQYRPFTTGLNLTLSRDDLRLAVTETATAAERELRLRDREMAWKLAYELLRREVLGMDNYRPIASIDKAWLNGNLEQFCATLAARDGLALPTDIDWAQLEERGWVRQGEVMRLSLLRASFRRALELWLVCDLATYLQRHGYTVRLGTFCTRELTPRNILISARMAVANAAIG